MNSREHTSTNAHPLTKMYVRVSLRVGVYAHGELKKKKLLGVINKKY